MGQLAAQLNVNRLLTVVALDFKPRAMVHDDLFSIIPVTRDVGTYPTYGREWQRVSTTDVLDTKSTPGAEAMEIEGSGNTATYSLDLHRLKSRVDKNDEDNIDGPLTADDLAARRVRRNVMLRKEVIALDLLTSTANYATGLKLELTGASQAQWNQATSTGSKSPVAAILSGALAMAGAGGPDPTDMWAGFDVHTTLMNHPDLKERIALQTNKTPAAVTALIASFFGMERYHIVKSVRIDSAAGLTDSFSHVVTDKAGIFAVDRSDPKAHQFAVQFRKKGFPNAASWRRESRMMTKMVEYRDWYEYNLISNLGGYFLFNVLN